MLKQNAELGQDDWPAKETFNEYTVSRRRHVEFFKSMELDIYLYKNPKIVPDMDLKIYQDLLAYTFITRNVPAGARILDVGGGNSRILACFAHSHECWNVDKFEGLGNGPQEQKSDAYRLVRDYMGNFNSELPNNYFDLVFSVSTLEHVPDDADWRGRVIKDINRVLKPGGCSLHMLDCLLRSNDSYWHNPILKNIFKNCAPCNKFIPFENLFSDNSVWCMSKARYDQSWKPKVNNKTYKEVGRPFSYNVLWQKL